MRLHFFYDEDMDIDCLLSKGAESTNSPGLQTQAYAKMLEHTNNSTDRLRVKDFVHAYRPTNINQTIVKLQENWDSISQKFQTRAEKIFGIKIDDLIIAFLTVTGRFPYNIEKKYFYVSAEKENSNKTCMHELWHFYTWKKFGDQEDVIGASKYNELKEALTVLLNIECGDLLAGEVDSGYPQHEELRRKIVDLWNKTGDINTVWKECVSLEI